MTAQFDRRRARFRPQRTDDLRPVAAEWVGTVREWQACWVIEDGQFEGQWAWSIAEPTGVPYPPFAWVPECDLEWVDFETVPAHGEDDQSSAARVVTLEELLPWIYRERGHRVAQPRPFLRPAIDAAEPLE